MKKMIYPLLIIACLASCVASKADGGFQSVEYSRAFDNNSKSYPKVKLELDSNKSEIEFVVTFFSEVVKEARNSEFNFTEGDFAIRNFDSHNLTEFRIVFDEYVYYAYSHRDLGLIYCTEFSFQPPDKYYLSNHSGFKKEYVDSIVNECEQFYKGVWENAIPKVVK